MRILFVFLLLLKFIFSKNIGDSINSYLTDCELMKKKCGCVITTLKSKQNSLIDEYVTMYKCTTNENDVKSIKYFMFSLIQKMNDDI